jgi:hypothetical protein
MMRPVANAPLRPAPQSIRRSPWLCAFVATALAASFWTGMIWLAQRVVN